MALNRPKKREPNTIYFIYNLKNSKLGKDDVAPVTLYWYHDRVTEKFKNLFKVTPDQWSEKKSRVVKHTDYLRYNATLSRIEKAYNDLLMQLDLQNTPLTPQRYNQFIDEIVLKKKVKQKVNEYPNFNTFYARAIEQERVKWKASTISDQERTLKKIEDFDNSITSDKIEDFAEAFNTFLLSTGLTASSTVPKHHKNANKYLSKYCQFLFKNKLTEELLEPYKNFRIGRITGNRVDLTMEEVERIENINLRQGSEIAIVRDRFLFSCYTGLRLSDNSNLNTKHLHVSDISGVSIDMNMIQKVDYDLDLELRFLFKGRPEEILLSYITIPQIRMAQKTDQVQFVFPSVSESIINEKLKLIARQAGINKLLTFHVSRHTCGTNLADTGAGIDLIMEVMGIRKSDTARIYIHRSRERRKRKLSQLNWEIHKSGHIQDENLATSG